MQHVEFLGTPGSAKSTIATELINLLPNAVDLEEATLLAVRRSGHDGLARLVAQTTRKAENPVWKWTYARSTDRFSALTRFIHEHPEVIQRVTEAQQHRSARDRSQGLVLDWLLNLMARYQLAVEDPGAASHIVIDEGFCQRAVALFAHGFEERDTSHLNDYLDAIPLPDVVIVIDTPLEVCETRLEKKGWSKRVAELDRAQRHEFLLSTADVVDTVIDHLETTGARLVRIDGTRPTLETARTLVERLSR